MPEFKIKSADRLLAHHTLAANRNSQQINRCLNSKLNRPIACLHIILWLYIYANTSAHTHNTCIQFKIIDAMTLDDSELTISFIYSCTNFII